MSHHRHHDHLVEGVILGTLLSGKELSGDAAFWIGIMLVGGGFEFVFDHVGLLFILGLLAAVIGVAIAALVVSFNIAKTICLLLRSFIILIPRQWNEYLDQPPYLIEVPSRRQPPALNMRWGSRENENTRTALRSRAAAVD